MVATARSSTRTAVRLANNKFRWILTGQFSPHHREDDGGTIMREICEKLRLFAVNTCFKPSKENARNTGTATYCIQKSYVQPKNHR